MTVTCHAAELFIYVYEKPEIECMITLYMEIFRTYHERVLSHFTPHYAPLHHNTLNYTRLHYARLHYTTLHYTTLLQHTPHHAAPSNYARAIFCTNIDNLTRKSSAFLTENNVLIICYVLWSVSMLWYLTYCDKLNLKNYNLDNEKTIAIAKNKFPGHGIEYV